MEWFNPFQGSSSGSGGSGRPGKDGRGITSIVFKASTGGQVPGIAGATDTYEIRYTDNTSSTFVVKNGLNGNTPTFRETATDIEVSYDNGASWSKLVPLSDITGPEGPVASQEAVDISYDPSESALTATNIQEALDECAELLSQAKKITVNQLLEELKIENLI